jgi:hypothetical protein
MTRFDDLIEIFCCSTVVSKDWIRSFWCSTLSHKAATWISKFAIFSETLTSSVILSTVLSETAGEDGAARFSPRGALGSSSGGPGKGGSAGGLFLANNEIAEFNILTNH